MVVIISWYIEFRSLFCTSVLYVNYISVKLEGKLKTKNNNKKQFLELHIECICSFCLRCSPPLSLEINKQTRERKPNQMHNHPYATLCYAMLSRFSRV